MNYIKRSRLTYDQWKSITSKEVSGKIVCTDFFEGYIGLINIKQVSEAQKWKIDNKDMVVCDKRKNDIVVWYIDIIAEQGIEEDGVSYFDDLYLDLVVYPSGKIKVDDMDELEKALCQKDITQEQFDLAIKTEQKRSKYYDGQDIM